MKRLAAIALALFALHAAPALAISKQSGTQTMADGTSIAYDLYEPDGAAPPGGWPGVLLLHGLGGSKDDLAALGAALASKGYAALAYSARGEGTSTGNLGLAGPDEISDERAMEQWLAGLPEVSDTQIGAWGVSYGGGQIWNGLVAGIPYKAVCVVATWTDLYTALWPQDIARSGIVAGFAKAVVARSPLIAANATAAIQSTAPATIKALVAPRSSYTKLSSVTAPVYLFQGRVDWAFDVTQAENGFLRVRGPKHLYIGQFGHPPSTFTTPDMAYVQSQSVAWFDHYLKGAPNGIDKTKPVTIAAATGSKRTSFAALPKTKVVPVGFRGTTLRRTGASFLQPAETFGVSLLKVQVRKVSHYPRLVATVLAGGKPVTHGAIVPKVGLDTIRLANYVQYIPKKTRLQVVFGPSSAAPDIAYLGFGDSGSISLGPADLQLQVLTKPVSG
ncbi:MAG TPA: alpha/beta fold hydrolase [Gaiellaceae bacterium]|nr:alpha/beta fold hydrolase [Gaiellaceae bacterium]